MSGPRPGRRRAATWRPGESMSGAPYDDGRKDMSTQTRDQGPGDPVVPLDDGDAGNRHGSATVIAGPVSAIERQSVPGRRAGRRRVVAAGAVITVAVAGALAAFVFKPWQPPAQAAGAEQKVSTAAVARADVSTLVTEQGTLGYLARSDGTDYQVVNWGTGVYTWLPAVGAKVGCGQAAYSIDSMPVVLLCGTTPLYRGMSLGMRGVDVRQLNKNLVALGYARSSLVSGNWNYFGSETECALKKFQAKIKATTPSSQRRKCGLPRSVPHSAPVPGQVPRLSLGRPRHGRSR